MNTISYLKEVYGYGVPIFLKDIRIGGKSKVSIRKDLSRGVEKGDLKRQAQGIYYLDEKKDLPTTISIQDIFNIRYIGNDLGLGGAYIETYGYYTGMTFLNFIGVTQQVPAVLEIVTNNTSCKREINISGYRAILRKSKIEIDNANYKILQFLDMFYYVSIDEIYKHREGLRKYINDNFTLKEYIRYIVYYPKKTQALIAAGGLMDAFK